MFEHVYKILNISINLRENLLNSLQILYVYLLQFIIIFLFYAINYLSLFNLHELHFTTRFEFFFFFISTNSISIEIKIGKLKKIREIFI